MHITLAAILIMNELFIIIIFIIVQNYTPAQIKKQDPTCMFQLAESVFRIHYIILCMTMPHVFSIFFFILIDKTGV